MTAATSTPTRRSGTSTATTRRIAAVRSARRRRSRRRAIRSSRATARSTTTRSRSPIRGRSATSPTCCLHALFEPGAVRQDRLVGRVRQGALRHRPVQDHGVQAAHQRHAEPERGLLGQEQGAEARQDDPVPDARGDDPARRAALRPGRLDRGAAAGCGAEPQGAPGSRSSPAAIRMSGRGCSTSASPTRRGGTCGCAGRSITASIARAGHAC